MDATSPDLNRTSVAVEAHREQTAKLTPRGSTMAPRGRGKPGRSAEPP
jgi:hypothetical protein